MLSRDSDQNWQRYGAEDPYYGVLSQSQYRRGKMDDAARAAFFETGEAYVADCLDTIRAALYPGFQPKTGLDFGCGVGRLALPMARRMESVTGVDISPDMLAEAARNAEQFGLANLDWVLADDALSKVSGTFDFINSFIVFQHILPERGEKIFAALVDHLAPDGVAALHFPYAWDTSTTHRLLAWMKRNIPFATTLVNLATGQRLFEPAMMMNDYQLARLYTILQQKGITEIHSLLLNHEGHRSVVLFFRKNVSRGFRNHGV